LQLPKGNTNDTGKKGLVTKRRAFFYIFSLLIFGFVIYYFSEITQEFHMLKKINTFWLLLALVLQLLTYLINAFIYHQLLKVYNTQHLPSIKELYKASVISLFFNQTIPSAGISGNTFLFNFFEQKKISSPVILSLIVAELLTFYAAMEFIIILFIVFSFVYKWSYIFHGVLLAGFVVYLAFAIAVVIVGKRKTIDVLYKKFGKKKLFRGFFEKLKTDFKNRNLSHDSIELFSLLNEQKLVLIKAFFLQLLLFTTDLFTIVALFNGLDMYVSILLVALALITTKIISLLPFSPGSLILYESSMTFFFVSLSIPLGPSIIVTLIYRLFSFWLPIPSGLILYRQWLKKETHTHYSLS
jgi:uncharacterized protein (TIRG00374 family)